MSTPASVPRSYRGQTAEERLVDRRRRLLDAGLDVIGRVGFAAMSVRGVCRAAGVTERAFYESFPSREDLLAAVYEAVVATVRDAVIATLRDESDDPRVRIGAGVRAFLGTLTGDPRLARVQLLEVVGFSDALEARRRDVMAGYVSLLAAEAQQLRPDLAAAPERVQVLCTLMVGGLDALAVDLVRGRLTAPIDHLTDHVTAAFLALLGAPLAPSADLE